MPEEVVVQQDQEDGRGNPLQLQQSAQSPADTGQPNSH